MYLSETAFCWLWWLALITLAASWVYRLARERTPVAGFALTAILLAVAYAGRRTIAGIAPREQHATADAFACFALLLFAACFIKSAREYRPAYIAVALLALAIGARIICL